jgi:hypothetical protein
MLMEGLGGLLLQLGGPVLAKAIARRFGGEMGDFAQDALDALGKAFGVEATEEKVTRAIETVAAQTPDKAKAMVTVAEADMAAVMLAEAQVMAQANEQQRMTNELLQAAAKTPGWRSDWLYAWQWFLLFVWAWMIVLVPVLNAALRIFATRTSTDLITGQLSHEAPTIWAPDLGVMVTLTGLYLGLHMGGHTVLELVRNKWGGLFSKSEGGKAD